jgi:hypothetical protein
MALAAAGCRSPSERANYRIACDAVTSQLGPASDVRLPSISGVKLYVAKNAGQVLLSADYKNAQGDKMTRSYTVWTKRVARTWTLDRCFPTPTY